MKQVDSPLNRNHPYLRLYHSEIANLIKKLSKHRSSSNLERKKIIVKSPEFSEDNFSNFLNMNQPDRKYSKYQSKVNKQVTNDKMENSSSFIKNQSRDFETLSEEDIIPDGYLERQMPTGLIELSELIKKVHLLNESKEYKTKEMNEIMSFIRSSNNLKLFLNNEEFLINFKTLMQHLLFRCHEYKIIDPNIENMNLTSRNIIEDLVFQEDSSLKIKDRNWIRISIGYELLITFLNYSDSYSSILDKNFLKNLIANIQSFDYEERNIIKLLIHKMYGASLHFRKTILTLLESKLIDICYNTSNNTNYFTSKTFEVLGVNELLEILKCIICGLKSPFNETNLLFISRACFPLLKNKFLHIFWDNLKDLLIKICKVDLNVSIQLMNFMSLSWPRSYRDMIFNYIELFETLMDLSTYNSTNKVVNRLIKKIILCINDTNFLVCDKSLSLFKNSKLVNIFVNFQMENLIAKSLIENIKSHWNSEIVFISKLVMSKLIKDNVNFLNAVNSTDKILVEKLNVFDYKEDMWGVHFDLKVD